MRHRQSRSNTKGGVPVVRWLICITGKQRREVDVNLLVQAVIALGHQLAEEAKGVDSRAKEDVNEISTTASVTGEEAS